MKKRNMAQIKCKACGNMVSSEAESCTNCGCSMELAIEITPELTEAVQKYYCYWLEPFHEGLAVVVKGGRRLDYEETYLGSKILLVIQRLEQHGYSYRASFDDIIEELENCLKTENDL